jgi:hypothetical protein
MVSVPANATVVSPQALEGADSARFEALWRMMSDGKALRAGDEVVFFAEDIDVDPSRRESPVLARRELARRTA